MNDDREMLNELIVESREHLETIEPDLLELEQKGNDVSDDLINRVFRAVHSIKGGFGFFGMKTIVNLSHAMENVMSRIRDRELDVTDDVTEALLEGIDKLRILLDDVDGSDEIDINQELNNLKPFLTGVAEKNIKSSTGENFEEEPSREMTIEELKKTSKKLTDDVINDAVKNGKLIYQVILNVEEDIIVKEKSINEIFTGWRKFGDIIETTPSEEELTDDSIKKIKEISVIYITVLEPDLIGDGLELTMDKILNMDISSYKEKLLTKVKTVSSKSGATSSKTQKRKNGIEDALRVKVSLLNNLMNNAGELVLARNQLVQYVNRSFADTSEAAKSSKAIEDSLSAMFLEINNRLKASGSSVTIDTESELKKLNNIMNTAFNYRVSDIQGMNNIVQNIDMVTAVLQEGIMQTRMQPVSVVFSKFPRVIRDLAKKLNKEIELVQIGQEVELDKSIIELLSDPLTHLIRNSADHGIETKEERTKKGKDPKGTVFLKAYQEGSNVIIEIDDDGAGIDPEKVKAKALEKGIITQDKADTMSEKEAQMLIFAPGFSTAQAVSDVSGRGVGMDVVKTNIEKLGGTIDIDSTPGDGSKVIMKLPLTLAIIPALIVISENRRFAVPQVGLEEVVRIRAKEITSKIEKIHDSEVLRLRGKLLPLVRLSVTLGLVPTFVHPVTRQVMEDKRVRYSDRRGSLTQQEEEREINDKRTGKQDRRENISNALKILVLRNEKQLYGLIVDDVLDSEEIVVKPLPNYLKTIQCYAGATIMGDGKVAMILDPNGIATMAKLNFELINKEILSEKELAKKNMSENTEDMLLFTVGGNEHFAINLSDIARIEKRSVSEIELVSGSEFIKNGDSTLKLMRLENYMPISGAMEQQESIFVIVPKGATQPIGFVAQRVEDTVQTVLNLDRDAVKGFGIMGSMILKDNLTIVVNVNELLTAVES